MSKLKDYEKTQAVEDFFLTFRNKFRKESILDNKFHEYDCWILSFLLINGESTIKSLASHMAFYLDTDQTSLINRTDALKAQGMITGKFGMVSLSKEARQMLEVVSIDELKHKRKSYEELVRLMDTWGAIFVVGAGFSSASNVPLTEELMPAVLKSLEVANIKNPKMHYQKDKLGCWEIIKKKSRALTHFKRLFTEMNDEKLPNSAHRALVRLFGREREESYRGVHIVYMNWDDLLERAYTIEYGIGLRYLKFHQLVITKEGITSNHAIWKMQGDVNDPKSEWILPHEKGVVFKSFLNSVSGKPFVSVIIGYSEGDEEIVRKLIGRLDKSSIVFRISPDLQTNYGERKINGSATEALDWIERIFKSKWKVPTTKRVRR